MQPEKEKKFEDTIEELNSSNSRLCKPSSGEDWLLEDTADFILARGRRGVTKHSEMRTELSRSQLELRKSREVMPAQGYPEIHLYSGIYGRAHNPTSRGRHSSNASPNLELDTETYYGG